jgi:hypothetical protein
MYLYKLHAHSLLNLSQFPPSEMSQTVIATHSGYFFISVDRNGYFLSGYFYYLLIFLLFIVYFIIYININIIFLLSGYFFQSTETDLRVKPVRFTGDGMITVSSRHKFGMKYKKCIRVHVVNVTMIKGHFQDDLITVTFKKSCIFHKYTYWLCNLC